MDRGDLLGAVHVSLERLGLTPVALLEGPGRLRQALEMVRTQRALLLLASEPFTTGYVSCLDLLAMCRAEGWRLVMLDEGVDSDRASADLVAGYHRRAAALLPQVVASGGHVMPPAHHPPRGGGW